MLEKSKKLVIGATLVLLVTGCATQANKDPLEGVNRGVYKFNDVTDRYVFKPVAKTYKTVTPSPIRKGINNFFNNLGSITTVFNDLLQFKFSTAFTDAGRFVINSTFGIAGFIDVASMDNIPVHKEDFGQTLGYWGVGNGAYLVLPFLGPSTVRDTTGFVFDYFTTDPITYVHKDDVAASNVLRGVQVIDKRAELLDAKDITDSASLDPYAFVRDAYLQRRASLVQDGDGTAANANDGFEPADDDAPKVEPVAPAAVPTAPANN